MTKTLPGKRILVVEDNPILAYDLESLIEENGAQTVGPALDLSTGLKLARETRLDAALLDIDLGDEFVWPLARELADNSVPFVFVSAQCCTTLPDDFSDHACLEKPAESAHIVATLTNAIGD